MRTSSGVFAVVTEKEAEAICDAGPLIHLDELGSLDLLSDFPRILVPEQVRLEVERHRPAAFGHSGISLEVLPVALSSSPSFQATVRALALDTGEQAALSLAAQRPGAILLTDDSAARLAARTLGFRVHGTIGVLVRAIRRRTRDRDEVIELIRAIPIRSTLYLRSSLLEQILDELRTSP